MEKMMQRLTMDKATQYTRKEVEKLRRRAEELVGRHCRIALLHVVD